MVDDSVDVMNPNGLLRRAFGAENTDIDGNQVPTNSGKVRTFITSTGLSTDTIDYLFNSFTSDGKKEKAENDSNKQEDKKM